MEPYQIKKTKYGPKRGVVYYINAPGNVGMRACVRRAKETEKAMYELVLQCNGSDRNEIAWRAEVVANNEEEALAKGKEKISKLLYDFAERVETAIYDPDADDSNPFFRKNLK